MLNEQSSFHSPPPPRYRLPSPPLAAERLGMWTKDSLSLSGEELEMLPSHQLTATISQSSLFYRVTPKHKVIIVKVLMNISQSESTVFVCLASISRLSQDFVISLTTLFLCPSCAGSTGAGQDSGHDRRRH